MVVDINESNFKQAKNEIDKIFNYKYLADSSLQFTYGMHHDDTKNE